MRILELIMFITWFVLLQVAVARIWGAGKPPNCRERCGDLTIDYPFGINDGCYLNESHGGFRVNCVDHIPTLAAAAGSTHNFTILEIRLPNQVRLETSKIMAVDCRNESEIFALDVSIALPEPFLVSNSSNRFKGMGCGYAMAYINNRSESNTSFCCYSSFCYETPCIYDDLSQCKILLPEGSTGYNYDITSDNFTTKCRYALLADDKYEVNDSVLDNYVDKEKKVVNESIRFPLVGEWVIKNGKCVNNISTTCGQNATCSYSPSKSGYNCYCNRDYKGNPYLNGTDGCRKVVHFPTLEVALAAGFAFAAAVGASSYAYRSWAKKKLIMKKTSEFLNESLDIDDGEDDDHNGDNNLKDFNKARLDQKGGRLALWARRRMVSKATDGTNNQTVEIRKYTVQDMDQLKNFVKGARTLSRTVIHPNVARLLGIRTRESSLIYRYFSDNTLHDRLHGDPKGPPSLEERLKIAVGTASGLAFAHAKGIYHGNVKSSNILLDESCNCNVVDFGVARLWRRNTLVKSSKGYVDPQYLKQSSNQLTSMMDVYSFGVVLVELITGLDPCAKFFIQLWRNSVEEGRLQELVDKRICSEERKAQLEDVAEVAVLCLQQDAIRRPEMVVVRDELCKSEKELDLASPENPVAEQFDESLLRSNLHECLHSSHENHPSWEERLNIAVGTARQISLAHSKGNYHGNVTSSNILIDYRYNCKVVGFGEMRVSRRKKLLDSGYVDPDYLKQNSSNELTSTMDVYSFGVVLVELITRQDPSAKAFKQREGGLAMWFKSGILEKGLVREFIDNKIWGESRRAQLEAVAEVATQCLAKKRPNMKEVTKELQRASAGSTPVELGNLHLGKYGEVQG